MTKTNCCEVMERYHRIVGGYFSAGGECDVAHSAHADEDSITLSTGFDHVVLKLNYCPRCGAKQESAGT